MAHPRRRNWTLEALDRSRGYWLHFDAQGNRWVLLTQDENGEWQPVITRD